MAGLTRITAQIEMEVLAQCVESFESLDGNQAAMDRVLRYLSDRYGRRQPTWPSTMDLVPPGVSPQDVRLASE
jgi:hypothetical protein